jgi:hypothetical protein
MTAMIDYAVAMIDCAQARWSPRIGDPSAMGWATVAAYAVAAALAWRTARAGRFPPERRLVERLFWVALSVGLAALAVNKQLDLQSGLTALGRCMAQIDGWYAHRRAVQAAFVMALGAGAALAAIVAVIALRRSLARLWLALVGAAALGAFVMIRAVGFHHIDALIGLEIGGWRINWILELGGVALIALGAVWARAMGPRG